MLVKNSKKAKISHLLAREALVKRDIPEGIFSQLEEHTEGYLLFYLKEGKLCVAEDGEQNDAKRLGLQTMSKEYLETVIEDGRDTQKAMVLARMSDF